MHRMRRLFALSGLTLASLSALGATASADLIRNDATEARAYPDVSADINGTVNYNYNAATGIGLFTVNNTPWTIAGSANDKGKSVGEDASGQQRQTLTLTLDKNGNLVPGAGNSYSLYGSVTDGNGQTYNGLLLQGTPTQFGSLDLGPKAASSDIFDVNMNITGGLLAKFYGPDAYMKITPEVNSTFVGNFAQDFSAQKATSNTRGYHSPTPFPVPEPTTLLVIVAGGAVAAYRQRRRLGR